MKSKGDVWEPVEAFLPRIKHLQEVVVQRVTPIRGNLRVKEGNERRE